MYIIDNRRNNMLTVKQVAEKFNVSPMTIYRWIRKGELRAFRLSSKVMRIREDDLNEFLKRKRTNERKN